MQFSLLFHTYLAAEILAPLFASFLILSCVLFLGRIIPLLDVLLDFGISFADFIRLCAYICPQLFLFSLPMATMIGVIVGFSRLVNDREIMAFKAAGIGLSRMLPVVMVIGFLVAVLTGFFSMRLIPAGNIALEKLLFQLAKEKIDRGLQEKRFSERLGDIVFYAEHIDPSTKQLSGVYVSDTGEQTSPKTILARSGTLIADPDGMRLTLTLLNGSLQRIMGDTSQDIMFERYVLQLPWQTPDSAYTMAMGKRTLRQQELMNRARQLGLDTTEGAAMLIEYHKRLVLPAGCFILALLGLPLGLMAAPGRRQIGLSLGLILFVFYYILISAAMSFSEELVVPVAPAMWLPNILFMVMTVYLIRSTAREVLTDRVERAAARIHGLTGRIKEILSSGPRKDDADRGGGMET